MKTMSFWRRAASAAMTASLVLATPLVAQRGEGGGGNYDPATELTLSGTVQRVVEMPGPAGGPGGLHLIVLGDGVANEVHLGPATFVSFTFVPGDEVTLTGSKVKLANGDAVIAREITIGDKTLVLRDERGVPLWAGHGRARR